MKKFEWLVLIDLWKEESALELIEGHLKYPAYKDNYQLLVRNLEFFDFKKVLFFNATFEKNNFQKVDIESCFKDYLNKNNIEYHIVTPHETFHHDIINSKSSVLIGGQEWNACLHAREVGFIDMFHKGNDVWTSPLLCIKKELHQNGFTNTEDFEKDKRILWERKDNYLLQIKSLSLDFYKFWKENNFTEKKFGT